jgi:trk system potassium uptake protein TrkH
MGERDRGDLFNALRRLLALTFGAEAAGAVLLAVLFMTEGDTLLQALWRGLFTAVSAFCNAGFALQTDNLVPYQKNGFILHIVAALIIVGGLSPAVVLAIPRLLRRKAVPMQAKLVLTATAVFLAGGALAIAIVEWHNTLGDLSLLSRLNNAWLQSATLRTAGFNSVDIAAMEPAALSLMMLFMFIGGSPGGTAGGIKTTTAMVLLLTVLGSIRGRWEASAFGRRIPHQTVYKAAVITTIGLLSALGGYIALQLTQALPSDMALFEIVSAFGTVGLSTGGTALLDGVGKVIIMTAMFMGRVGSLTLFIFLAGRSTSALWSLPEEEIDVG